MFVLLSFINSLILITDSGLWQSNKFFPINCRPPSLANDETDFSFISRIMPFLSQTVIAAGNSSIQLTFISIPYSILGNNIITYAKICSSGRFQKLKDILRFTVKNKRR